MNRDAFRITDESSVGLLDMCSGSWAYEYFNVYRPWQRPGSTCASVIPALINGMIDGKPPTIFGDGEQQRDFINVDDVVRADLHAGESNAAVGN